MKPSHPTLLSIAASVRPVPRRPRPRRVSPPMTPGRRRFLAVMPGAAFLFLAARLVAAEPALTAAPSAIQFDGNGILGRGARESDFDLPTALTLETWVRLEPALTSGRDEWVPIVGKGNSWALGVRSKSTTLAFRTTVDGRQGDLLSETNLLPGLWYHVALVFDGTNKHLYLDGMPHRSVAEAGALTLNDEPVVLAGPADKGAPAFGGALDNTRLWSVARSPKEIRTNLLTNTQGDEPGLLAEWRYDVGQPAAEGIDYSIWNRHLTFTNLVAASLVPGPQHGLPSVIPALDSPHRALQFDGSGNQWVRSRWAFLQDFNGSGTSNLTVEVWFRPGELDGRDQSLLEHAGAFQLSISQTNRLRFDLSTRDGPTTVAGGVLAPDKWHWAAAVYQGTNVSLFLDGSPVASGAATGTFEDALEPIVIGGNTQDPRRAFRGALDTVRIWRVVRTEEELRVNRLRRMRGQETGLLAEWRFDESTGAVALDASYGDRHADLSGFSNDNRVVGIAFRDALPPTATEAGQAIDFEEFNAAAPPSEPRGVVIASEAPFDSRGPLTLEAWVKLAVPLNGRQALMTKGTAWGLFVRDGSLELRTDQGPAAVALAGTHSLTADRWYHVAAVVDGTENHLYLDGQPIARRAFTRPLDVNDARVVLGGCDQKIDGIALTNLVLRGALDSARVWSIARSAEEIAAHFERDLRGNEPGLLAEWRLNEGAGSEVLDSSANQLHGTTRGLVLPDARVDGLALRGPAPGELALAFEQPSAAPDQYVALAPDPGLAGPSLTVEAWVQIRRWPATAVALVSKGSDAWSLELRPSGKLAFMTAGLTQGGLPSENLFSSTTLPLDGWHHVAATYDPVSGVKTLYFDGLPDAQETGLAGTLGDNAWPVLIGASPTGESSVALASRFQGALDEVRLWNAARTHGQIRDNAARGLNGTEPGLLGWWRFDEGGGPTARDSSTPPVLPGTLAGMSSVNRVPGVSLGPPASPQYSLVFDGIDDYIAVSNAPSLTVLTHLTVEAWVRPDALDGTPGWRTIVFKGDTAGVAGYGLALDQDNRLRFFVDALSQNALASEGAVANGAWSHVAVVVSGDAGTTSFYINGKVVGRQNRADLANNTGSLFIGRQGNTSPPSNYFRGDLDEVRLWATARSDLEIQLLAFRPLPPGVTGLIAYWQFDEGSGALVGDSAGSGLSGSLMQFAPDAWGAGPEWGVEPLAAGVLLASHPDAAGLWIGNLQLTAVNEVQKAVNGTSEQVTPTAASFSVPVLLHVDATGATRLLKDVVLMQTRVDPSSTNLPSSVLLTDPRLIPQFDGVALKGGKRVGIRYGSAFYDFEGLDLPLLGGVGPGVGCVGIIDLPADHPTNPFRHRFHPQHQEGFNIRRQFSIQFVGGQADGIPQTPGYGVSKLAGVYQETLTGLHKIPLKTAGILTLQRVSEVTALNPHN